MQAIENLSQFGFIRNAPFRVQTTRPAQTIHTGLILPAGTTGLILELTTEYVLVDFGLSLFVIHLPIDSTLIRFVFNGGEK